MTQASSQIGLNGTRLVCFLSKLAMADAAFAHQNFSEHLGRLIDFGGSMRLSEFHDELQKVRHYVATAHDFRCSDGENFALIQSETRARSWVIQLS